MKIQGNFFTANCIIWGDQECLHHSCLSVVELLDLLNLLEIAYLAICVTDLTERMAQPVLSQINLVRVEWRKMAEFQFHSSPSEVGKHNRK